MQLRFRFRPSQNVNFGGSFVSAENEKYGFGRSLILCEFLPSLHERMILRDGEQKGVRPSLEFSVFRTGFKYYAQIK